MLHTIYASQAEEVTKRLDRIAKKAAKYNVPFSYTVSEEHPQKVAVKVIGPDCRTAETVHTFTVAAVDIDINCDGFIRANGWTVCAKIEHGQEGNIVTPFGGAAVEDSWYSAPARCDHCGTNRARTVTFMCRNADGQLRQVGRSCLKEYTGISPDAAVMWADVRNLFDEGMDCTETEFASRGAVKMYDVETVLALAVDSINAHGYIKSDCPNSTRSQIQDGISKAKPTDEAVEKAHAIKDWLVHLQDGGEVVLGPERDCVALAKSGWAKMHHFGRLAAYMPLAYDRYMERKAAEEKKAAVAARLVTSWDNQFGTTYLYKFTDAAGNVFVWYASRSINLQDGMKLVGTVKDHTTYDGIKQTVLTRCKVA